MTGVEHKVQMSIDDWKEYENDDDISIAIGRVEFLSDAPNSHRHIYSLDVIKKYADTYLGKFVVAKWDKYTQDAGTHEYDQTIVGYIPSTQKVQYEQKENGYWYASVDVVISKIYAPEIYGVLKSDSRSVSVEQLVGFSKETENLIDGQDDKIVEGFEGIGITILGRRFNPSVPNANIKITRMSEDNVQDIEQEYVQYSQKNNKEDSDITQKILAKLENIENKLNIDKEEQMADIKDEELAEVKDETMANPTDDKEVKDKEEMSDDTQETMAQEETQEKEPVENACDDKAEMADDAEDKKDEAEKEEPVKNACDDKAEMANLEEKLSKAEAKMSAMETELAELREFKSKVEMSQKEDIVNETLAQVKEFADAETYASFVESGKACEYAEITSWKNGVLASIASKALAKMSELTNEDGVLDMGMPQDTEVKTSIYD